MIASKTPYRISFIGGGSDYPSWYLKHGGETISTSINKYVYITIRELLPFFNHNTRVVYSKVEEVKNINNINHPCIKGLLKKYKLKNVEIHYDGDLPARSGMGSSSSFTVGLSNLLNYYRGIKISRNKLMYDAISFEQKTLRENVGSQDQAIAAFGGFRNIKYNENGKITVKKMNIKESKLKKFENNLFLTYTNITRYADRIASHYINDIPNKMKNIERNLKLVQDFKRILVSNNSIDYVGELLDETWKLKKELSNVISNSSINELYNFGIRSGSTGGKLLGAGGGGFILFYVPQKNHKKFKKNMIKKLIVPFNFEKNGSKIIRI